MVLLDKESTMELLCNQDFVEDIKKLKGHLRIHSNGIEMSINKKSNIPGYNKRMWFIRRAITDSIALKN